MPNTLQMYNKLCRYPGGKWLFGKFVCRMAPYFGTIKPRFVELKPGYCEATLHKRRCVENHLHTVHAIAMANLCELTAGLMTEVSIPKQMRWIPISMEIFYLRKAKTDVKGVAKLELPTWQDSQDIKVPVSVTDKDNNEVVKAVISMRVSKRD